MGFVAATALIMGNMIGAGIFLLPASLAPLGWNGVAGWIITISGTLVLAWVLAALTRARPEAQDSTGLVAEAFGKMTAFVVMWSYWITLWIGLATIAIAGISYLSAYVPLAAWHPLAPTGAAIAMIWALTVLNLGGVKAAGQFQVVTLAIKILPLLAVMAIAFLALAGGEAQLQPFDPGTLSASQVNAAGALTLFALLGFECASLAARRTRNPEVTVPRATMWGTAVVGVIYLVVCSAIALLLPAAEVAGSSAPFATFVGKFWGAGPAALVAAFAVVSCVGAVNGWILLQGEVPRAMAERGMLPRWFGKTNHAGSPTGALVLSSGLATVTLLLNAEPSLQGMFEFLLLLTTSIALWFYIALVAAAWHLRVARPFAAIGLAYGLWTLWGAGLGASLWGIALMAAGLPLWWMEQRAQAKGAGQRG